MSNNLSDALGGEESEDETDDEDVWEEDNGMAAESSAAAPSASTNGGATELSKLLDPAYAIYQDEDDEEDPDALADPLYRLNLKQYLTEFVSEFSKQPYFPHFSQHLTHVEKSSLGNIGVHVP